MNKKIAIQLFGYLRSHNETLKSFFARVVKINKQAGFDVDIFIHTWDYQSQDNSERTDLNEVIKKYNPKAILIDSQKELFNDKEINIIINNKKRKVNDIYNLFYSVNSVNKLRNKYEVENKIKYDWVIHTRFDIFFNSDFCISNFIKIYNQNNLKYNDNSIFYARSLFSRANIEDELFLSHSDLVYFGNSITMNKATSVIKNFDLVINKEYFSTEWFIYNHWKRSGLKPLGVNFIFDKNFWIFRNNIIKISCFSSFL